VRSEKEKMLSGELYTATDPELAADAARAETLLARFNAAVGAPVEERRGILTALFGSIGAGSIVRAPLSCDYGTNIHLGRSVFINANCVLLDVMAIRIGDRAQLGPGVQILAADHPRDPETRRAGLEFGRPVSIGANAWIGAGALILPGVGVGEDAIVGAGAVVTRDVPDGTTVAGNPARPLRRRPLEE